MADLGVMEMCWGLGSLSPLRDRLMAFSPAGRSASDSRDKTRKGVGGGEGGRRRIIINLGVLSPTGVQLQLPLATTKVAPEGMILQSQEQ